MNTTEPTPNPLVALAAIAITLSLVIALILLTSCGPDLGSGAAPYFVAGTDCWWARMDSSSFSVNEYALACPNATISTGGLAYYAWLWEDFGNGSVPFQYRLQVCGRSTGCTLDTDGWGGKSRWRTVSERLRGNQYMREAVKQNIGHRIATTNGDLNAGKVMNAAVDELEQQ